MDANRDTIGYYNNERKDILAYVPDNITTILDVGCGKGAFLKVAKIKTGAQTWGIEMEPDIAN